MTGESSPTVREVIKEEWKKLTLSSVLVVITFFYATIQAKRNPTSPLPAIIAGIPTGIITTMLISRAALPSFLNSYRKASFILFLSAYAFYLGYSHIPEVREHPHATAVAVILMWAAANYAVRTHGA